MTRNILLTLAASVATAAFAYAADPVNLSGDWKMNAARSDFGQRPAPEKLERKIAHEGVNLTIATTMSSPMGESNTETKYTTDGKECVNTTRMGEVKSTLKWEGKVLVVSSKFSVQGNEITSVDRWSLSEDGKELTVDTNLTAPMGQMTMKTVMEKK